MKKVFTLLALVMLCAASSFGASTKSIFEWNNADGADDYTAKAGTIEQKNGQSNRLNYSNTALETTYKTICLNGKKANITAEDGTDNAMYMLVTLTQALKEGDVISMSAFRNKNNTTAGASAYLLFDNNAEVTIGGEGFDFVNLNTAGDTPEATAPNTLIYTVTAAEAGATSIKLSRNKAGTNLFITSLIVTTKEEKPDVPHDYNYDVTNTYIVNADLTDGVNGWTSKTAGTFTGTQKQAASGGATEAYAGWGSLDITDYALTQKITLPKGKYKLVNGAFFRQGVNYDTDPSKSLAYLKAGDKQVAIKTLGSESFVKAANSQAEGAGVFSSGMYQNEIAFDIDADNTEIEIGVVGTFDLKQSWCIVGEFKLYNLDAIQTKVNMTQYIANNSFENGLTGWQTEGEWAEQTNGNEAQVGTRYVEKWSGGDPMPDGKIYQTISVPNGKYTLSANVVGNGGSGVFIFANDAIVDAPTVAAIVSVDVEVTDGTLTIGCARESATGNWVGVDNFQLTRNEMLKNTLLKADNYSVTGKVVSLVPEALIPESFKKYVANETYNASADLAGDEVELIFWTNTESGLLNGYSIKGDAVQYEDTKSFQLNGKTFKVCGVNGEANGELKITQIDETHFAMEPCAISYNGIMIAKVTDFVIFYDPTEVNGVKAAETKAAGVIKYVKEGKLIIKNGDNEYSVSGALLK